RPLRHGDGLHRPADPQQLPAHPPAMTPFGTPTRSVSEARPLPRLRFGLVCCVFLLAGVARAGDGEPVVALRAADRTTPTRPLTKIAEDWAVRLGGARPALVAGTDVLSLRRQGVALPPAPGGEQVILSNGDRVPLEPGTALRLGGERLDCVPRA